MVYLLILLVESFKEKLLVVMKPNLSVCIFVSYVGVPSKSEREKQASYINAYRRNLEKCADEPIARTSQVPLVIKNPPANAGDIRDVGLILAAGRCPGGGHGNPLQCSCLKSPYGQRSLVGDSPVTVRHD